MPCLRIFRNICLNRYLRNKYALIPEAVNTVIKNHIGYIKYLSYFQGSINDDIQEYLKACLMEALPKFRFDR